MSGQNNTTNKHHLVRFKDVNVLFNNAFALHMHRNRLVSFHIQTNIFKEILLKEFQVEKILKEIFFNAIFPKSHQKVPSSCYLGQHNFFCFINSYMYQAPQLEMCLGYVYFFQIRLHICSNFQKQGIDVMLLVFALGERHI